VSLDFLACVFSLGYDVPGSCKRVDEGEYSGGDVGDMDFQEMIVCKQIPASVEQHEYEYLESLSF